jgi:ketosteroid isomerase-like protein
LTDARSLAISLAEAFGDADAVVELLTDDAEWWISPTVEVLGSPSVGKAAIAEAMRTIFGAIYRDAHAELHQAIGEGDFGSVRLTLRARIGERSYENEYCLWVRRAGDRIDRVWEYLDVAHASQQFRGDAP